MGNATTDTASITVATVRPPGWFDVADVVGERTLAEIADLRAELERLYQLALAAGQRWRAAGADVERCIDATIAQGGRASAGFDTAFAGWTRAAAGLAHLADVGTLIVHQLDGSLDDFDLRDRTDLQALLDGDVCA